MSTNYTDALVDSVMTQITTNHSTYFAGMASTGFALAALKQVKKGLPNPAKLFSPSVFVASEKTTRDGALHLITVSVWYYLRGNDGEILARSIARGADALAQLLDDKFSLTRLEYQFDYGLTEGNQEAAAQISAEIVI